MKFLKKLFKKTEETKTEPLTISEFWDWFTENQQRFFLVVKHHKNIESEFINPVFDKLNQIRKGAFLLAGMEDDNKAELILTAEGNLNSFPYVSKLVDSAPQLKNWKFTSFKPPMNSPNFGIEMGAKSFSTKNIFFYPVVEDDYPDDIVIKLTYQEDYEEDEDKLIENGTFIFIENYLGEIKVNTQIDELSFEHKVGEEVELNTIDKLEDYINWREKEFIEKYEGTIYDSEESNYSSLEWEHEEQPIIGVCNSDLIKWDAKASHPWVMIITIEFGKKENNGMPSEELLKDIYQFEEELRIILADSDGYLHVAQSTGLGERSIYYANKDFLKPITVLEEYKEKVSFKYDFEIFKDKYWRSMKQFEY